MFFVEYDVCDEPEYLEYVIVVGNEQTGDNSFSDGLMLHACQHSLSIRK